MDVCWYVEPKRREEDVEDSPEVPLYMEPKWSSDGVWNGDDDPKVLLDDVRRDEGPGADENDGEGGAS